MAIVGGLPAIGSSLMSPIVIAGGTQFAFFGMVLDRGSLIVAVIAGLENI